MRTSHRLHALSSLFVFALCGHAHAQSAELSVATARAGQLRVDGDLGEWRGVRAKLFGDASDSSLELRLAHDASGLFIAAAVHDDTLVRSERPSAAEDALVLELALPDGDRTRVSELWLYAGELGRTRAQLTMLEPPQRAARVLAAPAQIIEGPLNDGYVIEAFVPWSALPGGENFRFARARLRLHDVDRAGQPAHELVSAAETRPERWPWLMVDGGPIAVVANFLRDKSLTTSATKLDWIGDFRGDARAERLLVVGTYLVISDTEAGLSFQDLPITRAADLRSAELRDLTGDGKPELIVKLRQENTLGVRELLQVYELAAERARVSFALETRKQTAAGFVEAELEIKAGRAGKPTEIIVRSGRAQGLTDTTYQETPAAGIEGILLPWGAVAERAYAWDGTRFAVLRERPNAQAARAASSKRSVQPVAAEPASVVHLEPPGSDALIEAYRHARNIPDAQPPRFVQHANLAEDTRVESLLVFGPELVVVGDGFRGGVGFFYFGLPVQSGADVLRVFTGDVTGDGRRELFVRVRQLIGDVQREILLGYSFTSGSFAPLLAVEVRRVRAAQSIGNVVSLVREGRAFALQIQPGVAEGWSASTYPYVGESGDGIAPLLLPWNDTKARYRFDGKSLVAKPND